MNLKKIGKEEEVIGCIHKRWGGVLRELFTDADTFDIQFPANAEAKDRMLLIAAVYLLDDLFFSSNNLIALKKPKNQVVKKKFPPKKNN